MKKFIVSIAFIGILLFTAQNIIAQEPAPPPSGGHAQSGNSPNGGGAPIGGGLGILLAMGVVYGGKKIYNWNHKNHKLEE
jgi:hypothetical protein